MKNFIQFFCFIMLLFLSNTTKAQENELICSQKNDFCFQIPANFFMLTTNDIESPTLSYVTIDGTSSIEIMNGSLNEQTDFHQLYQSVLSQYNDKKYRITLKKEYNGFFILSGYTPKGKGFYQKVIKIENDYASAYLEFPKGNKKYSNISQMIFDYFEKSVVN